MSAGAASAAADTAAALGPGPCRHHARLVAGLRQANPLTVITGALRALCLGGRTARPAALAAAWLAALLAVTVPAAVARYRHAAST